MNFIWLEREKKKNNTTINNNLTNIRRHMPHNIDEDTVGHSKRQHKVRFGYRVVSNPLSK
jgi:hypothetical protein